MSFSLGRYLLSLGRVCFKLVITGWFVYLGAKYRPIYIYIYIYIYICVCVWRNILGFIV